MKVLKALRKRAGLTQGDTANRLGISQSYLSLIEKGKRKLPISQCAQLAQILNVTPDFLLNGKQAGEFKIPTGRRTAAGIKDHRKRKQEAITSIECGLQEIEHSIEILTKQARAIKLRLREIESALITLQS